jgi:predicted enzyme related to lactoylglutathione lyase
VPVVSVYVRDLVEARSFYCDLLGFAEGERYGDAILTLKNEGSMIVLEQIQDGSAPRVTPALQVDDIDTEFSRLKAQNESIRQHAPVPFPAGRMFTIADPSGNDIDVLQFEP